MLLSYLDKTLLKMIKIMLSDRLFMKVQLSGF